MIESEVNWIDNDQYLYSFALNWFFPGHGLPEAHNCAAPVFIIVRHKYKNWDFLKVYFWSAWRLIQVQVTTY